MNHTELTETQKKAWNKVAPGWEKWDSLLHEGWVFLNHLLAGQARLGPGQKVLDIGCGTGYPAILAGEIVGREGQVVGVDLAENMVAAAGKKARSMGLEHVTFRTADAANLQFESGSFNAVLSRFCLMFVPDPGKALQEIARVLKPRGYLAAAVWGAPDKNPYLKLPIDVLKTFIEVPAPPPDAPGLFRLAEPGLLAGLAQKAGFEVLSDSEVTGEVPIDSPDQYYSHVMEISAPLQGLFAKLTPAQSREAESAIKAEVARYRVDGALGLPFAVRLLVARKA